MVSPMKHPFGWLNLENLDLLSWTWIPVVARGQSPIIIIKLGERQSPLLEVNGSSLHP